MAANESEELLWELHECFNFNDRNGDGLVCGGELSSMLRSLGQYWPLAELEKLAKEFPPDTYVGLDTFVEICRRRRGMTPDMAELRDAFEVLDRNKTGEVQMEDLKHVLTTLGEKLTEAEVEELCSLSGLRRQGGEATLTFNEFAAMFCSSK